jgi:hypothetical protein
MSAAARVSATKVYRELGVRSRFQLATALAARGWGTSGGPLSDRHPIGRGDVTDHESRGTRVCEGACLRDWPRTSERLSHRRRRRQPRADRVVEAAGGARRPS